ncbi:glycoside hydrolase family 2 TIM barrel-domain containing protein [Ancylobacter sp. WKF20]|uniref:glycoside hydrolase family 2 TIM barrel-domain containing protein n=1 Tax=Ancylobacter sp. WKF20 TaxID=3039801 RepID=UPI0024341813|nr:glycoside hydrolase family 2 TIM barrel-domain containing protein [Ancylobacter sp. WKF20]WGD29648.1 glycoside hydrolase family 2 TIM barrel-domain containing protein [Ancylobacter sp. WKF20]
MSRRRLGLIGRSLGLFGLIVHLTALTLHPVQAAEVSVAGAEIRVDGAPFAVRGAAGEGRLNLLKSLGATTIRSYGGDPGALLDEAQAAGLKLIVGLWVGQPRQGADYADPAFVARQRDELQAIVNKYKNHPALLMWGIGNEVEVDLADPALVWPEIEKIASMVKGLDPDHPTMAVLAEVGGDKAAHLRKAAPSIDVLGINSYGDALFSVATRAREQGWTGPIVIAEMGALGQWQAATTPWGAPFEPSSTQKAIQFRRYLRALADQQAGAITFLWGQKQEVTPTFHSLFLPSGEWTEPLESMAESWGAPVPGGNHAPRIATLRVAGNPSAPFADWGPEGGAVTLDVIDPDGDPLEVRWTVMAESAVRGIGGDKEDLPRAYPEAVSAARPTGARIGNLPAGHYRLFVEVLDGRGAAATANLPFAIR